RTPARVRSCVAKFRLRWVTATRRVDASQTSPLPQPVIPHTIRDMNGLMMDYPLTLSTIFRRAETVFRTQEIVWRMADKTVRRYTCAEFADRARRLAQVLLDLCVKPADRVATLR